MSHKLLKITDYTEDDINFDLPNNKNGCIQCNNINNYIYQTPKLVNKSKVYENNGNKCLDLLVTDNSFKNFLKNVDTSIVNETKKKNNLWFRKELPEETLVSFYNSILKKDKNEEYITVQLTDKSKIYDEEHKNLSSDEIKEIDNVILLITIDNIVFNKDSYYCNIIGNHIKVYRQKLSLTDMIKTNNILNNDIINNLVSEEDEEDNEEAEEEDDLDDYEISSRMIINKRKELTNVYKDAEDASINAHKLRKEAIELAQELEEYESMKTEMN